MYLHPDASTSRHSLGKLPLSGDTFALHAVDVQAVVAAPAVPPPFPPPMFLARAILCFTGAINQKIGRFELADRGALFLDEVGDLPLELQPKLLRVLQEQEFERLGGNRPQRVDVRVVAATNQDLKQMVRDREFREDFWVVARQMA
jgi:hypothetical protein